MTDWKEIFKVQLEAKKEMKESDDDRIRQAGTMLEFEEGKKLELTVEVTDTELASLVLGGAYGGDQRIPGMKVYNVRIRDLEHRSEIVSWLEDQIFKLEDELRENR